MGDCTLPQFCGDYNNNYYYYYLPLSLRHTRNIVLVFNTFDEEFKSLTVKVFNIGFEGLIFVFGSWFYATRKKYNYLLYGKASLR